MLDVLVVTPFFNKIFFACKIDSRLAFARMLSFPYVTGSCMPVAATVGLNLPANGGQLKWLRDNEPVAARQMQY